MGVVRSAPQSNREQYNDVFCGTGLLDGKYHIVLHVSIVPVVLAPRRFPLALRNRLKVELQRLVEFQIITLVSEPTPWVSNLVLVQRGVLEHRYATQSLPLSHTGQFVTSLEQGKSVQSS